MSEMNAADIAALTRDGDGWGNGSCFALIILFAIIFGGNGFGFGNRENYATPADIQRTVDNAAIQGDIQRTANEQVAITKDAAYNNLSEIRDLEAQVTTGFANQQKCCCDTQAMLLENRYLSAQEAAQTRAEAERHANRILDYLTNKEINDLRDQNMRCYIQNQTQGIPRVSNIGYGVVPNFPAPQPGPQPFPYGNL